MRAEQTKVARPADHALPPLVPASDFEEPAWWRWCDEQLAIDDTAAAVMEWT